MPRPLKDIYLSRALKIDDTKVRQLMSDYLFSPGDANIPVRQLSGGQKARLQLIEMLADNPSLLVLDEPTNHLDLPSIEELEVALGNFGGAILYSSHDTFFRNILVGKWYSCKYAYNSDCSTRGQGCATGGEHGCVLVVHVREHTVDGRANTATIKLLAEYYDVPATSISIVHGQMAAVKVFEILQ